ncbi:MAG: hypothetical protein AB7F96_05660 [Beijerinckiaceae bacterium]
MTAASTYRPMPARKWTSESIAFGVTLFAVVAAVVWQLLRGANPDVVWLSIAAERWLDGETLYRNILETNPPAAVLLYVPMVWAGHALGALPERLIVPYTLAVFSLALFLTWRIISRTRYASQFQWSWLLFATVLLFVVFPFGMLGQREHFAAMATLVYVAAIAARVDGHKLAFWAIAATGVAGGLIGAIKPTLAAVPVFVALAGALHIRSWRIVLAAENWIAAALFAAYLALVYFGFPAFVQETMPMLRDGYIHYYPVATVLRDMNVQIVLGTVLFAALLHWRDAVKGPFSLLFAASAGFMVSFWVQGKYFGYHALPVVAFALLAIAFVALQRKPGSSKTVGAQTGIEAQGAISLAAALLFASILSYANYGQTYGGKLTQALRALHSAPKVVGVISTLHPMLGEVRNANGTWVGAFGGAVVPEFAFWMRNVESVTRDHDSRLRHWEHWTADVFRKDLMDKAPDVVLMTVEQGFSWSKWFAKYPALQGELQKYDLVRRLDVGKDMFPIDIYVRKNGR